MPTHVENEVTRAGAHDDDLGADRCVGHKTRDGCVRGQVGPLLEGDEKVDLGVPAAAVDADAALVDGIHSSEDGFEQRETFGERVFDRGEDREDLGLHGLHG